MNQKKQVLLFNLFFLFLLVAFSFIPIRNLGKLKNYKAINIIEDLQRDTQVYSDRKQNISNKITVDSTNKNSTIKDYLSSSELVNASGDKYAVSHFLKKLKEQEQFKNKKIRIGYFGDSFIEGDLITHDLRTLLQNNFGGDGVGFMPVTSLSAGFRTSITQSFSKNWKDISFKSEDKSEENIFLSGHTYYSDTDSWVNFKGVNETHLDSFTRIEILYGVPSVNESRNSLSINGKEQKLNSEKLFNSQLVSLEKTNNIHISTNHLSPSLFGFALESGTGIFVDNFSFRGISGTELDNFKPEFMQQVQSAHPYDLLVLHYGPNLLFKPNLVDFSWYRNRMGDVLKKIRIAFPETSILLVSTADQGAKYDGKWTTEKGVIPLIDTQYELALSNKMDFFNLYNAMGGRNSMVDWVEQTPSLANKDYTHVNFRGAKKIAEILYSKIMAELKHYNQND